MESGDKSKFYISFGIWIAILPHLGVPSIWKTGLMTASGIFLLLTALGPIVLKKLQVETKEVVKKRSYARKPKVAVENKVEAKEIKTEEIEIEKTTEEITGIPEKSQIKIQRRHLESKPEPAHEIKTP